MLELQCYGGLKKVAWKNISPGVIIINGARVNDTTPPELFNYPVLSAGLIFEITKKYHFRDGKEVVVALPQKGCSPEKLAISLRNIEKRCKTVNDFRKYILYKKNEYLKNGFIELKNPDLRVFNSGYVCSTENILSAFNSFEVKIKGIQPPSIFNFLNEAVSVADIFNNTILKKFNFPDDRNVTLHFVIDYSKEMAESKYLKETILAFESLKKFCLECNMNLTLNVYGFSDECLPLKIPISERDLERKGRNFASFQKKILHCKKSDTTNKVILVSCGVPDDFVDAIETGAKLKRNKIDYSQIIIQKIPLKTPLEKLRAICMTSNGNQIVLKESNLIEIVILEILDIYLGNLSLANKVIREPEFKEFSRPINAVKKEVSEKQRVVKPFQFKKI